MILMGRLKEVLKTEKLSRKDVKDLDLVQKSIIREWRDKDVICEILDEASLTVGLMSILGIAETATGIISFAAAVASSTFSNTGLKPYLEKGRDGISELEDFIQEFEDVEEIEMMATFYEDDDGFRAVEQTGSEYITRVKIDGEWQASPYVRKPDTSYKEVNPYDVNHERSAARKAESIAYDVRFDRHGNLKVEDFYFGESVVNGEYHTEYYKFEAPRTGNYDIDFKSDGGKLRLFIFDLENRADRMVKLTSEGSREDTVEKFHRGDEYLIGIRCYEEDEEVEYDLTIEYK
jgi:hypothetical protein